MENQKNRGNKSTQFIAWDILTFWIGAIIFSGVFWYGVYHLARWVMS